MRPETRIVLAGAGGYLLGRTRKMRLALALGTMLAAKRSTSGATGQLQEALKASPEASKLAGDLRAFLGAAGKAAATKTLAGRIDDLSALLRERAEDLRGEAASPEGEAAQPERFEEEGEADQSEEAEEAAEAVEPKKAGKPAAAQESEKPAERAPRRPIRRTTPATRTTRRPRGA